MSINDPKTKPGQQGKEGQQGKDKSDQQHQGHGQQQQKGNQQQQGGQQQQGSQQKKAFDSGTQNNSTNQPGKNDKGYDEKNPQKPAQPDQRERPRVTNEDNDITNSDKQNRVSEEPVDEQSPGNLADNKDPEIDTPIYDPEKTEKKIPSMKGDSK